MASIDKILQESYDHIEGAFRRFYNYHQLSQYNKKIDCYHTHRSDPAAYYQCFDAVERETIKDLRGSQRAYQQFQDELTICRFDCKTAPQEEKCMQQCNQTAKNNILEYYRAFYRSKIDKKAFERVNKLVKIQK